MTKELKDWVEKNKLMVSELSSDGSDIIQIDGVGKFLYLQPFEGKVINSDFAFELSDEDFDIVEKKEVDYILFEFGTLFYYSGLKRDRNRYNEVIYKPEFNDFKYLGKCAEPAVLDFVHLGVHSEYEILNGSGSCDLWAKKAAFLGCKKLGICDKNTLSASLPFQTACEKKGLKSIIGETVSVAVHYVEGELPELFELKLYVLNYEGWKNLLLINKEINVEHEKFVTEEFLYNHGSGLCCVIPKESKMNYYKDNTVLVTKLIAKYKKTFDMVYYQIDTVEYASEQMFKEHLKNIDTYLCNYKKFLKPILINDSYYLDEEEKGLRTMLNKVAGVASVESDTQYFKSVQETIDAYLEWIDDVKPLQDAIMQGLLNAAKLSDKIDFRIKTSERKLPKFDCKDVESLFFQEVEKGFNEHFGKLPKKEQKRYLAQLEIECNVIVPNGLCDYFMILWDIIKWCGDNNIMVGPGRGSVCGSLVAYCLNITSVDPLKYGLLFSRFLNETRVKPLDGFDVELENGKKFQIKKGDKLVLTNGKEVIIDSDVDLAGIDIDVDKSKITLI